MYEDALYAERAIRAGARGYIMKQEAASTIIEAIRTVRDGGIYVRKELIPRILNHGQNASATSRLAQFAARLDEFGPV
jgi:DNA-binding NarL/FixJ family response regulator